MRRNSDITPVWVLDQIEDVAGDSEMREIIVDCCVVPDKNDKLFVLLALRKHVRDSRSCLPTTTLFRQPIAVEKNEEKVPLLQSNCVLVKSLRIRKLFCDPLGERSFFPIPSMISSPDASNLNDKHIPSEVLV